MEEADIVVIGCGSGGSAVAGRLSEGGKYEVAVLEAGGRDTSLKHDHARHDAVPDRQDQLARSRRCPSQGSTGRRGYQPRGRGLGRVERGQRDALHSRPPRDYGEWAAISAAPAGAGTRCCPGSSRCERNVRGADAYARRRRPALGQRPELSRIRAADAFIEAASRAADPGQSPTSTARGRTASASIR